MSFIYIYTLSHNQKAGEGNNNNYSNNNNNVLLKIVWVHVASVRLSVSALDTLSVFIFMSFPRTLNHFPVSLTVYQPGHRQSVSHAHIHAYLYTCRAIKYCINVHLSGLLCQQDMRSLVYVCFMCYIHFRPSSYRIHIHIYTSNHICRTFDRTKFMISFLFSGWSTFYTHSCCLFSCCCCCFCYC